MAMWPQLTTSEIRRVGRVCWGGKFTAQLNSGRSGVGEGGCSAGRLLLCGSLFPGGGQQVHSRPEWGWSLWRPSSGWAMHGVHTLT